MPWVQERFQFILRLWPYTVPLFWVYAAEYLPLGLGRCGWSLGQRSFWKQLQLGIWAKCLNRSDLTMVHSRRLNLKYRMTFSRFLALGLRKATAVIQDPIWLLGRHGLPRHRSVEPQALVQAAGTAVEGADWKGHERPWILRGFSWKTQCFFFWWLWIFEKPSRFSDLLWGGRTSPTRWVSSSRGNRDAHVWFLFFCDLWSLELHMSGSSIEVVGFWLFEPSWLVRSFFMVICRSRKILWLGGFLQVGFLRTSELN